MSYEKKYFIVSALTAVVAFIGAYFILHYTAIYADTYYDTSSIAKFCSENFGLIGFFLIPFPPTCSLIALKIFDIYTDYQIDKKYLKKKTNK